MHWSTRFAWLAAWRRDRAARAAEPDGADMGTAFGLDACFEPLDAQALASPVPTPAPTWESRIVRRSGL